MRNVIIVAAAVAATVLTPTARADDTCVGTAVTDCAHHWDGPQLQTWDTPGFYGGNKVLCSPFNYQCHAVAAP